MNYVQYKGLVIADTQTCFSYDRPDVMPMLDEVLDGMPRGVSQCLCPTCVKLNTGIETRKTSRYSEYEDIPIEKTKELTAHQYLLCSNAVWAYVMKARSWRKCT